MHERIALPQPELESRGNLKGIALETLVRFYQDRYGKERLLRAVGLLPPWFRLFLETGAPGLGIDGGRWYATQVAQALHEALFTGMEEAEYASFVRDFGEYAARQLVRGPRRLLFSWFVSPERLARESQKAWSSVHDEGRLTAEIESETSHVLCVADWLGHDRFSCDLQVVLRAEIYKIAGCREVASERLACVAQGAPDCRYRVRWTR